MICREITWRSPYAAFAPLAGCAHAHLLHGGVRRAGAQWSIIAAFPVNVLELKGQDAEGWLQAIQARLNERKTDAANADCGAPFQSGLMGYVGYEALAGLEPSLNPPASPHAFAPAVFGVYDATAVFARHQQRAWIVGREQRACERLEAALGDEEIMPGSAPDFVDLTSNFSQARYYEAVSDVIECIRNGDFYQANIAQQLTASARVAFSPFSLFQMVAVASDAFFGAFLQYPAGAILSNSPERFFNITETEKGVRNIIVEPIKGTRPRSEDPVEDGHLAAALLEDPKDRAENIMIADLMRNDLSKICKDHSVREDAICELMTLARVHHLVSRISGVLRDDVNMTDVFRALFPSGSITGAPKIEAMKAIVRIEGVGRGPYCGAIGYIDDRGGADFSVSIRTMMAAEDNRRLTLPAGGGVTLRSRPADEYDETLVKAAGATGGLIDPRDYLS